MRFNGGLMGGLTGFTRVYFGFNRGLICFNKGLIWSNQSLIHGFNEGLIRV